MKMNQHMEMLITVGRLNTKCTQGLESNLHKLITLYIFRHDQHLYLELPYYVILCHGKDKKRANSKTKFRSTIANAVTSDIDQKKNFGETEQASFPH